MIFWKGFDHIIHPETLDSWEAKLFKSINEQFPEKVKRWFIRQEIVATILNERGVEAFGVTLYINETRLQTKQSRNIKRWFGSNK
ncbi:hypothetical protein IANJMKHF_00035 [Klebsiella phage CPRSA]|nr:hypothetical protein IANJMKHF_00035 [Klebsiella phage CPRSA]